MSLTVLDPLQAFLTILQSGVVVSGNTRIQVFTTLSGGQAPGGMMWSERISGYDEAIQLSRNSPWILSAVTGKSYQGAVQEQIVEDILIRRKTFDASGATAALLQTRVSDSISSVVSGVWSSGFNLTRPFLIRRQDPVIEGQFARSRLEWRVRWLL